MGEIRDDVVSELRAFAEIQRQAGGEEAARRAQTAP